MAINMEFNSNIGLKKCKKNYSLKGDKAIGLSITVPLGSTVVQHSTLVVVLECLHLMMRMGKQMVVIVFACLYYDKKIQIGETKVKMS